jgi:hypothetical protein
MSPPSDPKNTQHTPLSAPTSATTKKVRFEESELMAANALVEMANTGLTGFNKASTLATKADAGNESIVAESSKHNDGKTDDPVKLPKQKFVLKLGGYKKVEEKQPSATTGILSTDKAPTPAIKADVESRYIASMLRKGDLKISDDALKLLERGVRQFVLDLFKKNKRQGPDNSIKTEQRILEEKREADRKESQERDEERLAALLQRLTDAMEGQKRPGEPEETRLGREAAKRAEVAMYRDMFRSTTTDRGQVFQRLEASAALYEDIFDPDADFGLGIRLSVLRPLEKVGGEQPGGLVKTQQWAVLESAGLYGRRRQKLEGEARLTSGAALRAGASVLEFTFGPTADVKKPISAGGDKATMSEEPKKPRPPVRMPPRQHSGPSGAVRPLVQNEAWRAPFNGLFGCDISARETTLSSPKPVAAARKAVDNVKLQGSSAGTQQPSVEKLDAPTTLASPAATTEEVLASALSGIDISKAERPAIPAPKPQTQPPSKTKVRPSNPFYRSDMTLAIAAHNVAAYFREAADWLTFWHISTSASMLVDMSYKPTSTLNLIFNHLRWTAEFLRFGRVGWDLRCLPDNFFEDMLPLIMVSCGKLEKLGEWKGCGRMMIGAWKDAEEVGEMLATVRNVRVRDRKN